MWQDIEQTPASVGFFSGFIRYGRSQGFGHGRGIYLCADRHRDRVHRWSRRNQGGLHCGVTVHDQSSNQLSHQQKRVVHIELLSPDSVQENHAYYTLLGVSKQWLMLDGHHGIPDRIFRMNHLNVLEISNRVTATVRTGGWIGWARLAMWYVGWRNKGQSGPSH